MSTGPSGRLLAVSLTVTATLLAAVTSAWGQDAAELLHSFAGQTYPLDLYSPGSLIQASDGNFYGLSTYGGTDRSVGLYQPGEVLRVSPDGIPTVIHRFTGGAGGTQPKVLLQASDGNLYGIASAEVDYSYHFFVFRMTLGGDLTVVHAFPDRMGVGWLLQASDGNFYGSSDGGIFRMTPDGIVSSVTPFGVTGSLAQGRDGNLYCVGSSGVFKLTLAGATTLLHSFPYANDSFFPHRLVQAGDGNIYGATTNAGDNPNLGEIFRVTPSGDWTILHKFTGGVDGDAPWAGLTVGPDGNLYGTTSGGGPFGDGVVFRVTLDGAFSVLHGFTGAPDGSAPYSELLSASDGNLYGSTGGGAFGQGTFFRMSLDGVVTTLYAIKAGPDGAYPAAPIMQGSDGAFYGTTSHGGSYDSGVVFRTTSSSAHTILHEFNGGLDGRSPTTALVEGRDGYLYGATRYSGRFNAGTVFRMTPAGVFETLHAFAGFDGAEPNAALLAGSDGRFYGTTRIGGAFGLGTVFAMTANGDVTVLHSFAGDADGAEPVAPLILGADGVLYGTASTDGHPYNPWDGPCPALYGTAFSISPTGAFRTLHVFDGTAGRHPTEALLQATDGAFYGTTAGRCGGGYTIFRMMPGGSVVTLQPFASSALIQATDGKLYGTGSISPWFQGSVFQLNPDGTIRIVHAFSGKSDGGSPIGVMQARDENLYGATYYGGGDNLGVVFRIDLHLHEAPPTPSSVTAHAPAGGPVRLAWSEVPSATSFTIKRGITPGQETLLARGVVGTIFLDRSAAVGRRYYYVVTAVNGLGESVGSYEVSVSPGRAAIGDYDGDGKADMTVYRPTTGTWYVLQSGASWTTAVAFQFGASTDIPVPGDYDGDGKTDFAVFRPSTGVWYVWQSSTLTMTALQFGNGADIPVPADYDGDGKTDIAVFRPSTGVWYVWQSTTLTLAANQWANAGDIPVPGDYDGDGKADLTVFRPSNGIWYVRQSSTLTMAANQWASAGDIPVPADYDGDGITDLAVFRPTKGTWYVRQSTTLTMATFQWGNGADIPLPTPP